MADTLTAAGYPLLRMLRSVRGTLCPSAVGQSALPLCPRTSEVDFFGNLDGIVNLDAEVPNGALHLLMSKQKLHGPEVSSATIDQGSLGPPQRVRPELQWVETDAGGPFADETRVLPGGEAACFAAAARKQELPRAPSRQFEVVIDRLPSLLGDFEPNRSPRLQARYC